MISDDRDLKFNIEGIDYRGFNLTKLAEEETTVGSHSNTITHEEN